MFACGQLSSVAHLIHDFPFLRFSTLFFKKIPSRRVVFTIRLLLQPSLLRLLCFFAVSFAFGSQPSSIRRLCFCSVSVGFYSFLFGFQPVSVGFGSQPRLLLRLCVYAVSFYFYAFSDGFGSYPSLFRFLRFYAVSVGFGFATELVSALVFLF